MANETINYVEEAARIASASLLPEKSKTRYELAYDIFKKWCSGNNVGDVTENVLLAYFLEKSKTMSPSSLWSVYSMLKLCISIDKNQDISNYKKLIAFIKRRNDGYEAKKSKIFTQEEITKFLVDAPNETYLAMKIVTILGVAGACRTDELYKMKISDLEFRDDIALVKVPDTKTNIRRSFVVSNDAESTIPYVQLLKKYIDARPKNAQDSRLFYRYDKGRCVNQVIGKHTICKVPRNIAKFLKLKDEKLYTGHSFRRTSATLLANSSGDILDLKRHGGWKSSAVAEGYIADSHVKKVEISKKILKGNFSVPYASNVCANATSFNVVTSVIDNKQDMDVQEEDTLIRGLDIHSSSMPPISFSGCSYCTFNFNFSK